MLLQFTTRLFPAARQLPAIARRASSIATKSVNGFVIAENIIIPETVIEVAASNIRKSSSKNGILVPPDTKKMEAEMIDYLSLGASRGSKECDEFLKLIEATKKPNAPDIIIGSILWNENIEDLFETILGDIKEPFTIRVGTNDESLQAHKRGMLMLSTLIPIIAKNHDSTTTMSCRVVPYIKDQTPNQLSPHTDFIENPDVRKLALCCLQGDGSSKTFFIAPDLIYKSMSEAEREILSHKIYHRVRNGSNIGPFPIFEMTKEELRITISFTNGRDSMQARSDDPSEVRAANQALDNLLNVLYRTPKFEFGLSGKDGKLDMILTGNIPHGRAEAPESTQPFVNRVVVGGGFSVTS